jgi:hypothetical protein
MIVPQYWAESRIQQKKDKRQVTIRRFGWSDTSQEDAQAMADARANEAIQLALSGSKVLRSEPKIAYNGAQGVPIREEVIQRYGETVITRNSYGAKCLNTPNVLFADIDLDVKMPFRWGSAVFIILLSLGILTGWQMQSKTIGIVLCIVSLILAYPIANGIHNIVQFVRGGSERVALQRVTNFFVQHPSWSARLYRTPSGFRMMVTHELFNPDDPRVADFFKAIGTDPVYVRMCKNQHCFRARLDPKPWRIGISDHIKPRVQAWPVSPEKMPMRTAWITAFEEKAKTYAACEFLETKGGGTIHPKIKPVQELHDRMCRAMSQLPIA